jgi:radical SAM superfamily enzyme YgiQ (UPF0313 family)
VEWYCGEERYRQNPTELSASLELIANWDEPKLEREKERFSALYRPVSILPPDQYFSLVLQATEGCHWNQCRFCSFYAQTPFYIKSAEEFTVHLRAVREFMGRSLGLRRSLFLGDANALVIPQEKLLAFLSIANAEFRVGFPGESREKNREAMEGVYSFLDVFTGTGKKAEDFAALQKMNLKRVYLGVETGSDELLEELRKPSSAGQAREVISALRKAGLQLGIIILVGVGGKRFYRSHVDSTLRLLNGLPWQEGDILYFSPLWLSEGSRSERESREKGWGPLSPGETLAQWQEIRDQLDFSPCTPPRIALYDIREFVY